MTYREFRERGRPKFEGVMCSEYRGIDIFQEGDDLFAYYYFTDPLSGCRIVERFLGDAETTIDWILDVVIPQDIACAGVWCEATGNWIAKEVFSD